MHKESNIQAESKVVSAQMHTVHERDASYEMESSPFPVGCRLRESGPGVLSPLHIHQWLFGVQRAWKSISGWKTVYMYTVWCHAVGAQKFELFWEDFCIYGKEISMVSFIIACTIVFVQVVQICCFLHIWEADGIWSSPFRFWPLPYVVVCCIMQPPIEQFT